ncbi:MAG: OB-fold domain-containing protein [Burkholderiales bacterium]|nr:OB-fold domain-containing protein [Burkholderiales bacterium]
MTHARDPNEFPQPYRLPDAEPYWQELERERLTYQRCTNCGEAVWPAHSFCPHCDGPSLSWEKSRGRGAIYSFSTVMRGPTPVWAALVPYTVGFIQMDEGYVLFTQIEGSPEAMAVGKRVEVRYTRRGAQMLPVFSLTQS